MDFESSKVSVLDGAVIASYFLVVIGIGSWVSYRHRTQTTEDYFLGGRKFNFVLVGLSLFVSNIGSEHFVGFAGAGALSGIGVGAWEVSGAMCLILLANLFVPVYVSANITTVPEYLRKRFNRERISIYIAVITLIMYAILKIAINVYSGALFIEMVTGWSKYGSIFALLAVTCGVSVSGGLTAVMYIDTLQAVLMVGGAFVLFFVCLGKAEIYSIEQLKLAYLDTGYNLDQVRTQYNFTESYSSNFSALYSECSPPPGEKAFQLLRPNNDKTSPWLPWLIGCNSVSLWYWCTDQLMVQRTLSAKSLFHAQSGALLASFLKALPLVFMIIPGMLARVLFPDEVACVPGEHCQAVCGNTRGCANFAFPLLIVRLMPSGLKGLMSAVMLAALMSDLESIFNSAATLFTMDIWIKWRKGASETELVFVGRIAVVLLTIWAILWIPVIDSQSSGQLFFYGQEVANYLTPPIGAAFLLAVSWNGINETGTFWGLVVGTTMGILRLLMMISVGESTCSLTDTRPHWAKVHFLVYSSIIFIVTTLVIITVSNCTPSSEPAKYTFTSRPAVSQSANIELTTKDDDNDEDDLFSVEEPVVQTSRTWKMFDKALSLYQRKTNPAPVKKQSINVELFNSPQQRWIILGSSVLLLTFYVSFIIGMSV